MPARKAKSDHWPWPKGMRRPKKITKSSIPELEARLKELSKPLNKHKCRDDVAPLLKFIFARQNAERDQEKAENAMRRLDGQINAEVARLARKVGYTAG